MNHEEERKNAEVDVEDGFKSCFSNISLLYGRTYSDLSTQDLLGDLVRMECFQTNYNYLISMNHEEERKNAKVDVKDRFKPCFSNISLLYGRTYSDLSTQDF